MKATTTMEEPMGTEYSLSRTGLSIPDTGRTLNCMESAILSKMMDPPIVVR